MCACHFFIRSVSPHSTGAHCPEGIRHLNRRMVGAWGFAVIYGLRIDRPRRVDAGW